jgi:hypothetical protein
MGQRKSMKRTDKVEPGKGSPSGETFVATLLTGAALAAIALHKISNALPEPAARVVHIRDGVMEAGGAFGTQPLCETPGVRDIEPRWWPIGHSSVGVEEARLNPTRVTCDGCRRCMGERESGRGYRPRMGVLP